MVNAINCISSTLMSYGVNVFAIKQYGQRQISPATFTKKSYYIKIKTLSILKFHTKFTLLLKGLRPDKLIVSCTVARKKKENDINKKQ